MLSGLALAGANQRSSGDGEDGLLTALEVAGLDLWGTRMVVLSACETGVGDARNGEGVYGLRRALVLAGSESQVMSLWQVSDVATRDLMIAFYQRLRAGEGRAEALRNVQLAMLHGEAQPRPPVLLGELHPVRRLAPRLRLTTVAAAARMSEPSSNDKLLRSRKSVTSSNISR